MIGDKKRHYLVGSILFAMVLTGCQTGGERSEMVWMVQSSEKVRVGGEVLSTQAAPTSGWIPAKVPSTIMGVLTGNSIEKEALTADDYAKIDKTQFEKSWWYRKTFNLPALKEGEHVLLGFDGISYRANVWLNGQQIANSHSRLPTVRRWLVRSGSLSLM